MKILNGILLIVAIFCLAGAGWGQGQGENRNDKSIKKTASGQSQADNPPKGDISGRAAKRSAAKQRLEKKFAVKIGEDSVLFDDKQNPKAFVTQKDDEVRGTQGEGYFRPRRKLFFLKQTGEIKKSIDIKTYEETIIKKGDSPGATRISRISETVVLAQSGSLVLKLTDVYVGTESGLRTGGRGEGHLIVYDGDSNILCERDLSKEIFTGEMVVSRPGDAFALAFGRTGKKSDDGQWIPGAEAWLEFYDQQCKKIGEYRKSGFDAMVNISVTEDGSIFIERLRRGGDEGERIKANITVDFHGNILKGDA